MRIRFMIERDGRLYWQPSTELRREGWRIERLAEDWAAAVARAQALNRQVDAWRAGRAPPAEAAEAAAPVRPRPRVAPPGSVGALIADYKASRWHQDLRPKTRREYGWALDAIVDWAGDLPARAITPAAVQAFHQAMGQRVVERDGRRVRRTTPHRAAAAVRVLRLVLQVGIRLGYLDTNPAARPGLTTAPRAREPQLWTAAELAHMVATADRLGWISIGTAIVVNGYVGQRVSDLLAAPPIPAEGPWLLPQSKTGRTVALPARLVPAIVERIEAVAARPGALASPTHLLLHDRTGKPWSIYTFDDAFAAVRQAAAETMPSCARLQFRELRHYAATRLHESGVDDLGVAAITGHSAQTVRQVLERHYLVRTARAAEVALARRVAAEAG
jgi:integrase